jgi:hypothetical protein
MNSTVIQNQPFFLRILLRRIHLLSQPRKQRSDKIKILIFTISPLNYPPVHKPVITNYRYQGKSFSLWNRTVNCNLLVGPGPRLITCHV